jgi:CheY-like chemotaxis protein
MQEYLGSEPDAYVDKPIEPVVLRQTIKRLLKGKAGGA